MRVLPVKRLFPSRSLTCTLRVKMEWDLKRKERGRDEETKTKRWKDGKTERRKWEKKKRPNSRKQNPCQNMSETEKHKPTTTNHHLPRRLPVAHGFCSDSFGGGMFQHIKNFFGGGDFSFGQITHHHPTIFVVCNVQLGRSIFFHFVQPCLHDATPQDIPQWTKHTAVPVGK